MDCTLKVLVSRAPGVLTLAGSTGSPQAGSNGSETKGGGECDSAVQQALSIVLALVLVGEKLPLSATPSDPERSGKRQLFDLRESPRTRTKSANSILERTEIHCPETR